MKIKLVYTEGGRVLVRDYRGSYPLSELILDERYVIQDFLVQHEEINTLYPHSVNTVRAISMYDKHQNRDLILGANFRLGVGSAFVDNAHQGGIFIGLHPQTGRMAEFAVDYEINRYSHHPTTGIKFNDYQIPHWQETRELILKTQQSFRELRLLGHDIAITPKDPVSLNSTINLACRDLNSHADPY